jgi:hypothetical protein
LTTPGKGSAEQTHLNLNESSKGGRVEIGLHRLIERALKETVGTCGVKKVQTGAPLPLLSCTQVAAFAPLKLTIPETCWITMRCPAGTEPNAKKHVVPEVHDPLLSTWDW